MTDYIAGLFPETTSRITLFVYVPDNSTGKRVHNVVY